ncbi:MAG: helix-turn-helix domain-containing protein [Muribaculaceae bacterium]|nr:helix-turn-helix domain-containing protein [Muribaculaceae bacterium]MDE6610928.1 helix-turn-helix domain-containing protein [Muribaculaceae bacterium]
MDITSTEKAKEILARISSEHGVFDNSLTYAHLSSADFVDRVGALEAKGLKVEGSMFVLLSRGSLLINYNFKDYKIEAPSAISFPPGTIVQFSTDDMGDMEAYILDCEQKFLQDVNISFNAISGEALIGRETPVLELTENEMSHMLRYFTLVRQTMLDSYNTQLSKHILSSLISAMFYQMMLLFYKRIENVDAEAMGPRRGSYVHDFIKLVHLYYTKERSVSFYASKLFISPKYLSLLVKEATGRSAAKWIDYFVIMEAKNLLRYSGKNIQQVAYDLNFSNQSSFGKYFKHITGMSPTDFQKS